MLRLIFTGNSRPFSYPVDPSCEFEPGMVAQLTVLGNQLVATVSNGTAPFGIIDDIKTKAFHANAWDEVIVVAAQGVVGPGGKLVTPVDIKTELLNPNVVVDSFTSNPVPVKLIPRNGVIVFPAGTELNFDMTGSGTPDAIRTVVRYTYQIPNVIGDDSTLGNNRVTIWFQRFIGETDKFDTTAIYPVNANLFVNDNGMLTTKQPADNYPSVGIVTAPPSPILSTLQFLWL